MLELHIDEDNVIEWDEMADQNGSFINNSVVTFTLKDTAGVVVGSISGISMPYVAASNGQYQGTLTKANAAGLSRGERYFLEITSTASIDGFRRIECIAVYHGEA